MTRYPKKGKGHGWTAVELKGIAADWRGDTLSDGEGLSGEVRVGASGDVAIRWKYAFRWEGKVVWYQAGTWPTVSLQQVRERRDAARLQVRDGVNPNTKKLSDRIEVNRQSEAIIAADAEKRVADRTVCDMFDVWIRAKRSPQRLQREMQPLCD